MPCWQDVQPWIEKRILNTQVFSTEHFLSPPSSIISWRSPRRRNYERIQGDWWRPRRHQRWLYIDTKETGTETWNGPKESAAFNLTSCNVWTTETSAELVCLRFWLLHVGGFVFTSAFYIKQTLLFVKMCILIMPTQSYSIHAQAFLHEILTAQFDKRLQIFATSQWNFSKALSTHFKRFLEKMGYNVFLVF